MFDDDGIAAAAASLCVQVKGAIPSMPDRKSVLDLLGSLWGWCSLSRLARFAYK